MNLLYRLIIPNYLNIFFNLLRRESLISTGYNLSGSNVNTIIDAMKCCMLLKRITLFLSVLYHFIRNSNLLYDINLVR